MVPITREEAQNRHEIRRDQHQEGLAAKGEFDRIPEVEGFVHLVELGPLLDPQGGDDDQHHAGHRHPDHRHLQGKEGGQGARLGAKEIRDHKAQQHPHHAKERGRYLQVVALGVRLGHLGQKGGIDQADDGIAGVKGQHGHQHPPKDDLLFRFRRRQPDQDKGQRQEGGRVAHIGDAPAALGAGAVGDIAEKRVVDRVPDRIEARGESDPARRQAEIILVKDRQQRPIDPGDHLGPQRGDPPDHLVVPAQLDRSIMCAG